MKIHSIWIHRICYVARPRHKLYIKLVKHSDKYLPWKICWRSEDWTIFANANQTNGRKKHFINWCSGGFLWFKQRQEALSLLHWDGFPFFFGCVHSDRGVVQLLLRNLLREPSGVWARGPGRHLFCGHPTGRVPVFPHHPLLRPAAPGSIRTPKLHRLQLRRAGTPSPPTHVLTHYEHAHAIFDLSSQDAKKKKASTLMKGNTVHAPIEIELEKKQLKWDKLLQFGVKYPMYRTFKWCMHCRATSASCGGWGKVFQCETL